MCTLQSRKRIFQEQANPEGWWLLKQAGQEGEAWLEWVSRGWCNPWSRTSSVLPSCACLVWVGGQFGRAVGSTVVGMLVRSWC